MCVHVQCDKSLRPFSYLLDEENILRLLDPTLDLCWLTFSIQYIEYRLLLYVQSQDLYKLLLC